MFGTIKQASDMGAAAVGATIYFGSEQSARQIVEVAAAFALAHEMGMATVLWCYLRNNAFKKDKDYHVAADLTGQANHLGVTIQADIIKQKLPENEKIYLIDYSVDGPCLCDSLRTKANTSSRRETEGLCAAAKEDQSIAQWSKISNGSVRRSPESQRAVDRQDG